LLALALFLARRRCVVPARLGCAMRCHFINNRNSTTTKKMKISQHNIIAFAAAALFAASPVIAHEGHEHGEKDELASGETKKISGEVIDMACYVDHNATGEKHTDCAKKCITSGLPVGLKADDGKTYLLIGEHKPLNSELAQYAAKKITVEGKVTSRDGVNMIENAVIQK
jgi:hypothetical protein